MMIPTLRKLHAWHVPFVICIACASALPDQASAQPPNDNPINALNIAPTAGASCAVGCGQPGFYADGAPAACTPAQGGTNCTVASATNFGIAAPPCGNYQGGDVWFKFTVGAAAGQQSFRLTLFSGSTGTPMTDGAMAAYLYDGTSPLSSPSAFSFVSCADDGNGNMPVLALSCLTAGRTYYIRVWTYGNNQVANGQTFKLCFMRSNNNAPSNDDPCGAVDVPVNASCTNLPDGSVGPAVGYAPFARVPRNQYACETAVANPGCTIAAQNVFRGGDVWFKVTVPLNGAFTVTTSTPNAANPPNNSPGLTTMCMAAYTAGAGCSVYSSFNELVCNNGSNGTAMPSITLRCLTPGDIIYLRCYSIYNSAIGYFNICATSTADPVPAANDNPCGAINVPINTCLNSSSENNASACFTLGVPDPTCTTAATFTNGSTKDVWYKFTAPASGIATVDVNGGTSFKPGIAVYSTPSLCSDPMGLVGCNLGFASGNFNASLVLSGLTPSATYYVRVWGTATNGTASNTPATPFTICVNGISAPSAGNCYYVLQLIDTGSGAALGWGPSSGTCASGCTVIPPSGTSYVDVNVNGTHTYYSDPDENTYALFQVPSAGPTLTATYNANGNGSGAAQQYDLSVLGGGQVHPFPSGTTQTSFTAVNFCTVPPQPQQDCIGGQTICSSTTLFLPAATGTGNVVDLNGTNEGCLSTAERGGGRWFFFRTSTNTGSVEMTISPGGSFDIDFAIWRPYPVGTATLPNTGFATANCPPLGAPVRCSFAGNTGGNGGLSLSAAENSEGAGGDGFVHALVGGTDYGTNQAFILYINNFSSGALGNQNYTVSWNVTPSTLLDCTVLPVELIDITAEMNGSAVDVAWSTASEHNSSLFIVERSPDNEHFTAIGEVEAAGNTDQRVDYTFRDLSPMNGANYYRLEQVDLDGATIPTSSAVVFFGGEQEHPLLFPNPVADVLHAVFRVQRDGVHTCQVLDATGRLVAEHTTTLVEGNRTVDLDVGRLNAGTYLLRVVMPDGAVLPAGTFLKH